MKMADERIKLIQKWIQEKMPELMEDFCTILRIRSVAEPEKREPVFGEGCQQVLQKMLEIGESYGFETRNYDGYVGRITWKGTGEEEIGIWSHLDVVDDRNGRGFEWKYPPYEPTLTKEGVIARGAQDNKSSAIMALYVLRYLKEHGIRTKRSISLYCGTCEEQGMYDIDYFTANYPCPDLSLVPDAGFPVCQGERGSFNGELTSMEELSEEILDVRADSGLYMIPDNACIVLRRRKSIEENLSQLPERVKTECLKDRLVISFQGESIHAANPSKGVNALHGLVGFLLDRRILNERDEKIFRFVRKLNEDYWGSALDVNCEDELSGRIVLAGTQAKMEGRRLVISFISKYPVTRNDMDFEMLAGRAAEKNGFTLKVTRLSRAIVYPSDHPVLRLLTDIYNTISKEETKPFIMSGGTYARKLPNAFAYGAGIREEWPPAGMFPPGHGDYHQPDESVSYHRIRTALLIYIKSICELDSLESLS